MPRAWDDRQRGGDPADGWDEAPSGASAAEELAHEIALAAALDRSRRDLSPDPHASARMRNRLFEVLAQEGVAPRFGERPAVEPTDLTAPIGPPIAEDLDHSATSNRRSAGEHPPGSDDPRSPSRTRPRRGRHVLPSDHPDHPVGAAAAPSAPEERSGPGRDGDGDGRPGPRMLDRRRPSVRKRFGIVVGGFAALAVVAGVTSTVSRDALPGDGLYGVKRASESMGGVFTMGEQAEAARQLDLARSRVDEVENLMARSSSPSPDAISGAMDDFDRATSTGSRLMLSGSATEGADPSRLAELRTWAAAQSGRLSEIRDDLPAESRPEAAEAIRLLDRVLARAEALRATSGCAPADGGGSVDDLGPLPGECRTGGSDATAVKQSGTPAPQETSTAPDTGTSSPESSSTSPQTSTSEGSTESSESDGGDQAPLLGDRSTSSSPSSSTGSQTSEPETSDGLLPPITIPPLLPGLGPVSIG